MKFTDIKCDEVLSGSYYTYEIPLKQDEDHDVEAYIELIMEEDEYYLEVRTHVIPKKLPFGEQQPEVAFSTDLKDLDYYHAIDGTSDVLMNYLENIRKALSFLIFGNEDEFQFILN